MPHPREGEVGGGGGGVGRGGINKSRRIFTGRMRDPVGGRVVLVDAAPRDLRLTGRGKRERVLHFHLSR